MNFDSFVPLELCYISKPFLVWCFCRKFAVEYIFSNEEPETVLTQSVEKDEKGNSIKRAEILTPEELTAALAAIEEWKKVWG